MLKNVKGKDRGIYRCLADNGILPAAQHDVIFFVNATPSILPILTNISFYGPPWNRTALIACEIEGTFCFLVNISMNKLKF